MKKTVNVIRIFVGLLFLFSSFAKADDPIGFSYKMQEYFTVFGMTWMDGAALFFSIFICVVEMMLGFMILLGARVKLTLWLLLLMMIFFTFLTFYSAYFHKVLECGCFGDALHVTAWHSFWKDVVLLVLILFMFAGKQHIHPLYKSQSVENSVLFILLAGTIAFPIYTYNYLPVIDFRPYKVGVNIPSEMKGTPAILKYYYKLKNKATGEEKEFAEWPKDWSKDWTYVSNRTEVVRPGADPKIEDFSIASRDGADYTDSILKYPGYTFILIDYDLSKTKIDKSLDKEINDFVAQCQKNNVKFIGLTSSDDDQISIYRHKVQAMYNFYIADGTVLKTIIRSNPGLMLLKNGTIMAKWHYHSFPTFKEVKAKYLGK